MQTTTVLTGHDRERLRHARVRCTLQAVAGIVWVLLPTGLGGGLSTVL
jgi:hypothetical protein